MEEGGDSFGNDNARVGQALSRLSALRRRARRAMLIARQLAPVDDMAYHDEQLGEMALEELQDAPPTYDQHLRVIPRHCCC